jgi:hypothetical protein
MTNLKYTAVNATYAQLAALIDALKSGNVPVGFEEHERGVTYNARVRFVASVPGYPDDYDIVIRWESGDYDKFQEFLVTKNPPSAHVRDDGTVVGCVMFDKKMSFFDHLTDNEFDEMCKKTLDRAMETIRGEEADND